MCRRRPAVFHELRDWLDSTGALIAVGGRVTCASVWPTDRLALARCQWLLSTARSMTLSSPANGSSARCAQHGPLMLFLSAVAFVAAVLLIEACGGDVVRHLQGRF